MNNKKFDGADVILFTTDGKRVAELNPITFGQYETEKEPVYEVKESYDELKAYGFFQERIVTMTMKNVVINKETIDKLIGDLNKKTYTIIGTGCKFPRGNKFPKKKRIKKKWMKKYSTEFTVENVHVDF